MPSSISHKRKLLVNAAKKKLRNSASSSVLKLSEKSKTISNTSTNNNNNNNSKSSSQLKDGKKTTQSTPAKSSSLPTPVKNQEANAKLADTTNSLGVRKTKNANKHAKSKKLMPKPAATNSTASPSREATPVDQSQIQIVHAFRFSKRELNALDARIKELTGKLDQLKANKVDPSEFADDYAKLESESSESMQSITNFFARQVKEIEQQYLDETSKAAQEYHDKRSEFKETLRLENEEMRRKIGDIADLSIDYNENHLFVTSAKRKLRSRCHNLNSNLNIDHLLDVNNLF